MQEFQLKVISTENNNFSLELYQCAYRHAGEKKRPAAKCLGRLKETALVQARQAVYNCLKANNYDPKTLSQRRQTPLLPIEERQTVMAGAIAPILASQPTLIQHDFQEIVDGMIERKLDYFADNKRFIMSFELKDTGREFQLLVASTVGEAEQNG
jgi:hypothetical protein